MPSWMYFLIVEYRPPAIHHSSLTHTAGAVAASPPTASAATNSAVESHRTRNPCASGSTDIMSTEQRDEQRGEGSDDTEEVEEDEDEAAVTQTTEGSLLAAEFSPYEMEAMRIAQNSKKKKKTPSFKKLAARGSKLPPIDGAAAVVASENGYGGGDDGDADGGDMSFVSAAAVGGGSSIGSAMTASMASLGPALRAGQSKGVGSEGNGNGNGKGLGVVEGKTAEHMQAMAMAKRQTKELAASRRAAADLAAEKRRRQGSKANLVIVHKQHPKDVDAAAMKRERDKFMLVVCLPLVYFPPFFHVHIVHMSMQP